MSLPNNNLSQLKQDVQQHELRIAQSATKDEALENAIKAAEAAMRALKLAKDPAEKNQFSGNVTRLLNDAENIKAGKDWRKPLPSKSPIPLSGSVKLLREPQSKRPLPKSEQIILLKAGYLNGSKFPPWTTSPKVEEFDLRDGDALFTDESDLPLSEFQEEVFDDWKRPSDALPPPTWVSGDTANTGPIMNANGIVDLVQDAATDCSVVASLCAGSARVERGHVSLARSIIYPNDPQTGLPTISPNGKYILQLNFNGCKRKVVIDDRLPVSSTSRVIHVIDRRNPGLLWPALMEKAYLKVRGGYDFPGSNSGTDLWILTGWIPEQVFLQSDEFEPDRFWDRVSKAFDFGDVLITMGTGKMTDRLEKELGLAGEHDYVVLELREVGDQRLMLVKNPWCEGTSWRGRFKDLNQTSDAAEENGDLVQSSRDLLNADEQLSPGTFWMDLDNVIQHFESIYLNWNPGLFSHRQDLHFAWDLTDPNSNECKPRGRFASLRNHPQFKVKADAAGSIWILLWRHFRNAISSAATSEEIESGRYDIDLKGHINLAAFSTDGRRVLLPEKQLSMGWYVDSPQTVLRLNDCEGGKAYTLVPLEQDLLAANHTFSIVALSNSPLEISEATPKYNYSRTITSAWTTETAGGNAHSKIYCSNPQFAITVTRKTQLTILLDALDDALNVHVKLVHGQGKRIHTIRSKDIVVDSKDYRRGCCIAGIAELPAGDYTIITSTFETQQLGDFSLTVESVEPVRILQLPKQDAGRLKLQLNTIRIENGQKIIAAPLAIHRLVNVYSVIRRIDGGSNRSLARLSVEIGHGPHRRVLAVSGEGEYTDSTEDIRLPEIDLSPDMKKYGELWLIFDRLSASSEAQSESFTAELLVDQPDAVTCGQWQSWTE